MQIIRDVSPTERIVYEIHLMMSGAIRPTCIMFQSPTVHAGWYTYRRHYWSDKANRPIIPADVREEALRRVRESVKWED